MSTGTTTLASPRVEAPAAGLIQKLNTVWHERANQIFAVIVLAHWTEHLVQAFQIFVLGWPRTDSRGILGGIYPWLIKTEILHYGYALVMLVGLWILRPGFVGRARTWWTIALCIQFWHHIEHALLQGQVIFGHNLFGAPVPTSILQHWIPRIELHLFYNGIVFVPMVVAMYYHLFPTAEERTHQKCSCAYKPRVRAPEIA